MSSVRQRVPASASASENSEVSTSSSAAAKPTPAAAPVAEKPVTAEDSQRAVRFLALLSLAILVVPLVAWYLTQQLFGVGACARRRMFRRAADNHAHKTQEISMEHLLQYLQSTSL